MSVALPFVNSPQNLQRHVRSYAAWLLLIAPAAAYYPRFVKLSAGMETYPQAASCLWHGQMLQVCDQGFTYPPFFALVMLPFAPMPPWLRDFVRYGVTLAATIGAFKLCEYIACKSLAAPLERAELFWLRFFALLLSAKLILAVFENQAYDAFVLVAVVLGLSALSGDRPLAAGAGLALAAALKATPLIFLPYLLWKRHFAAAAAFVLVYALASLLPDLLFAPAGARGYFSTWLGEVAGPSLGVNPAGAPFVFWNGANILNHSLRGAVALNVDETHHRGLFDVALAVADGCFIVMVGTLVAVSPRRPQSIAIDGSLLLIAVDALIDDQPLALCRAAPTLYDAIGAQLARSAHRSTGPRGAGHKLRLGHARRQRRGGGSFYRLGLSAQRNGARHARSADLFRGIGDAAASEFK
ncbi:MAG TPA: glycosyltransferase family 87 protein [Xanthobacteraceae bacterium]|nr:glycosyltransferase family 87 protein [Xanthobacteraceae bacterium]